jgi:hypothetical protein
MLSPKMMQNLTKIITQSTKSMTSENKLQAGVLAELSKNLNKASDGSGGGNGMAKIMKEMTSTLQKAAKLVEAQTAVLEGIKPEDLSGGGDGDKSAEQVKELEEAVKRMTDENKKQKAEIDSLLAEIDKVAKEAGGDKDAGKKIKTATAALDKAAKLVDEQTKLLDEAKKALAA